MTLRTTFRSEPDPQNNGCWRIVNATTNVILAHGMTKADADSFVEKKNKQKK